jgi:hypothetical protein
MQRGKVRLLRCFSLTSAVKVNKRFWIQWFDRLCFTGWKTVELTKKLVSTTALARTFTWFQDLTAEAVVDEVVDCWIVIQLFECCC